MNFPFKTLKLYRVRKTFISERSNDKFEAGRRMTYLSSTSNHHEDIEICDFKDFDSGVVLVLHADYFLQEKAWDYFEEIPFPG